MYNGLVMCAIVLASRTFLLIGELEQTGCHVSKYDPCSERRPYLL